MAPFSTKKRSPVWKFFALPKSSKQEKVRCPKCGAEITYGGTTTGIKYHLKHGHTDHYEKLFEGNDEDNDQISPADADSLLVRALSTALIPFNACENPEMRLFVSSISNGTYELPRKDRVRKLLQDESEKYVQSLKERLAGTEQYTLLTDGYTNHQRNFHCYSLHISYVDSFFERHQLFCALRSVDEGTTVAIGKALTAMLDELGLKISKCSAMTSDAASPLVSLAKKHLLDRVHCGCHLLDLIIKEFANLPKIKEISKPALDLARFLAVHKNEKKRLNSMAADAKITTALPLPQSPTRWAGLYYVLDSYLAHYESIRNLTTLQKFVLAPELIQKMEDVRDMIKPLRDGILKMEKESSQSSEIIPTMVWIRAKIHKSSSSLKSRLLPIIAKRLETCKQNRRLLCAMVIDHRFAFSSNFLSRREWEEVEEHLEDYDRSERPSHPSTSPIQNDDSLDEFFSQSSGNSATTDLKTDILKYRALLESNRPSFSSPLQFWSGNRGNFPVLAAIAQELLGTPGSSANCEREFSRVTDFVHQLKRNRASTSTLNALLTVAEAAKLSRPQKTGSGIMEDDDGEVSGDDEQQNEEGIVKVWVEEEEEELEEVEENGNDDTLNVSMNSA